MGFTEKISVVIDAVTSSAKSGLSSLKGTTDEAEGSTSKLGGTIGNLKDKFLGAAASPAALMGGVGALVGLAGEGISQFENLGLEVDKFSTVTGNSADQSSRYIEVAKDHGVAVDALESSFGKMNKTAQLTPGVFDDMGVAIAKNKDGTIDSSATFQNAIDVLHNTNDAGRQAEIGMALFGKGWQGMAGIISGGAPQLRDDLASVQASKVFSEKDVQSSKDLRDGFDAIKDAGEGLFLTIGKSLAPTIAKLAPIIAKVIEQLGPAIQAIGEGLTNAAEAAMPAVEALSSVLDKVGPGLKLITEASLGSASSIGNAAGSYTELDKKMQAAGATQADFLAVTNHGKMTLEEATGAVGDWLAAHDPTPVQQAAAAEEDLDEATQQAAASIAEQTAVLKDQQTQLEADKKAQDDLSDAMRSAADASFDVEDKTTKYKDSITATSKAVEEAKGDQDKIQQAYRDNARAAADLADAQVKLRTEQDAANGVTTSATTKQDLFNQSLITSASQALPDQRQAIIDYIAQANNIPTDIATAIKAAVDSGDLDAANALLADASKARTATVNADADDASLAATNAALDDIAKPRSVRYDAIGGAATRGAHARGGVVGLNERESLVGEEGPEIAEYPAGTRFTPAPQTARRLAGAGGGNTYITINTHPGMSASDIVAEQRRWQRRNGRQS